VTPEEEQVAVQQAAQEQAMNNRAMIDSGVFPFTPFVLSSSLSSYTTLTC